MKIKDSIMKTLLELTAVPGISGTESENLSAYKIYEIFKEIEYFKNNPEYLNIVEIPDDPFKRCFVSALLRRGNASEKTVILTGHFDVVGIDEFGHLKEYAFNPDKLMGKIHELSLDEEAKKDLESSDYLFGRGVADMKFGIALEIELVRQISCDKNFEGNILFIGVPGEESNSEGMLGAVPYLVELKNKYKLEYTGLLLSECCLPKSPEDTTKKIYLGTCGKIMPLFFFAGKESHVCEPFNGINPILLSSEVTRLLEGNTDFCDVFKGETTPPPLCLKQLDLKNLYSVQTPLYSASYFNMLTLNTPTDVLVEKLKKLCTEAFINVLENRKKYKDIYENLSSTKSSFEIKPIVMTYNELYEKVKKEYGDGLDSYIEEKVQQWQSDGLDIQNISINIIKEVYEKFHQKKPMIIIAFAPPYYPHKYQNEKSEHYSDFMKVVNDVIDYANNTYNVEIKKEPFFMGICDLSYTGLGSSSEIESAAECMPAYPAVYKLPVESLKLLDIPGVVFGGFAKDFHKYTERLNISYSFNVVPDLYRYFIYKLLQ